MKNTVFGPVLSHTPISKAKEYLSALPVYVCLDDTFEAVVLKMYEFKLSKIIVCDKDFNAAGFISKDMVIEKMIEKEGEFNFSSLKKYRVFDAVKGYDGVIKMTSVYLESDVFKAIDAMKALKINYMPVLKSPWDKTLKGFIEFKKAKNVLKPCPGV